MAKLQVFDPPMCCSTGVCGPNVDPALASFAADLEWLKTNGIPVKRFNLAQQPAAFVENPVVAQAIRGGDDALPLLLVDGKIAAQGSYPSREQLAELVGLATADSIYSEAVQELVAIGAAIAANCEPCFRYHFDKARKLGVSKADVASAVTTAQGVKQAPARVILELAEKYVGAKIVIKEGPSACHAAAEPERTGAEGPNSGPRKCC